LQRGRHRDLVAAFPLRLLVPVTDLEIQSTLTLCCEELAHIIAEQWQQ
jgi:hypothetical protein